MARTRLNRLPILLRLWSWLPLLVGYTLLRLRLMRCTNGFMPVSMFPTLWLVWAMTLLMALSFGR